jgi:hypothetical protein
MGPRGGRARCRSGSLDGVAKGRERSDDDKALIRDATVGQLRQWQRAVELQDRRLVTGAVLDSENPGRSDGFDMWADSGLYVVAVRNLLRVVEMAGTAFRQEVGAEIREAKRRFRERVPRIEEARDTLEHFHEYTQGRGRARGIVRPPGGAWAYSVEGVTIHILNDLSIDTAETTPAALEMADRVLGLIWPVALAEARARSADH